MSTFPISWIRLGGHDAPAEPGVYLRASDVTAWLRHLGYDDAAVMLDDVAYWPASEAVEVRGVRV